MKVIEASGLSRWYGIVMGLNHVSFTIHGGITGLVGPNGAGKSTLIQIITGQLQPSSGSLTVFGETPWNRPGLLRRIGYCPEKEAIHEFLNPVDWLIGLSMISGIPEALAKKRATALLEMVQLPSQHWRRPMGEYSKGMRQRAKLAQALVHDPDLLILDEPMNGLDPMGRQEMASVLKALASEGKHILISSHILHELESICTGFLILHWGRVLASGNQDEIRSGLKDWPEEVSLRCDDSDKLIRMLVDRGLLKGFHHDETGMVQLQILNPEVFYPQLTAIFLESGVSISEIHGESRSLKSMFTKITTES